MGTGPSLCEKCAKGPPQIHCNTCAISLCRKCVADHVMNDTIVHQVVVYGMKNTYPVFPHCIPHSNPICEMYTVYCLECDLPLCVRCIISGSHLQHQMIEFNKIFKNEKERLEKRTNELESSIYTRYIDNISELQNLISKLPEYYEKLMSDVSRHGDEWHREIDTIINKTKQEVEKMKQKDIAVLNQKLTDMKNVISNIYQTIIDIRTILHSNNVTEIMAAFSKTTEFRYPPKKLDVNPPTFFVSSIEVEELNNYFGTLILSSVSEKAMTPLQQPNEVNIIDTQIENVKGVACFSLNEVWIYADGYQNIHFLNVDGSLQQIFTTRTRISPGGITVTPEGDFVYTDWSNKRNRMQEKIITVQDWTPYNIYSTTSGDLLVSMYKDSITPQKIVCYREFSVNRVIQFDRDDNPWFSTDSFSLFIAENKNGGICASDFKAEQVLAINLAGELRFRYTGNLSPRLYQSAFSPCGIATDALSEILVADKNNNCIHIIDENGHFLRYIDNCNIKDPFDLSIKDEFLFVAEFATGKVKKIQFLK